MDSITPAAGHVPAPARPQDAAAAPTSLPPLGVSPSRTVAFTQLPPPPSGPHRWPERTIAPYAPLPHHPYWPQPALPQLPPSDSPHSASTPATAYYARGPTLRHGHSDPAETAHAGYAPRPRPVHHPVSDPSGLMLRRGGPGYCQPPEDRTPTVHPYYGWSTSAYVPHNDRGSDHVSAHPSRHSDGFDARQAHPRRASSPIVDRHMHTGRRMTGPQDRPVIPVHWEPSPQVQLGPAAPSPAGVTTSIELSPTESHANASPSGPVDKASPSGSEESTRKKPSAAEGRRRRYKYLHARVKDSLDPKTLDSRKKVKRACIFCRRSHMPCEFRRPCGRCIKRQIAHLCTDDGSCTNSATSAFSAPASSGLPGEEPVSGSNSQSSSQKLNSSLVSCVGNRQGEDGTGDGRSISPPSTWDGSPSHMPDSAEDGKSGLVSSNGLSSLRLPPIPISLATNEPATGAKELSWSDGEGEVSLLNAADDAAAVSRLLKEEWGTLTEMMLNGDWPTRCVNRSSFTLASMACTELTQDMNREHELSIHAQRLYHDNPALQRSVHYPASVIQEEVLTLVALNAPRGPSRWGYGLMAEWLRESFDNDTRLSIDRTLSMVRLRYLRLGLVRPAQQELIDVSANNLVRHYRFNIFESIPSAMALITRSGKIFTGNTRLTEWLQLPSEVLFTKSVLYFSLVAGPDVAKVIEAYASAATFKEAEDKSALCGTRARPRGDVTLTHAFVVDRLAHLTGQRAWNPREMQYLPHSPRALDDGTPSIVRFRGHVTIQPILDQTANGVPHFFAIYVAR